MIQSLELGQKVTAYSTSNILGLAHSQMAVPLDLSNAYTKALGQLDSERKQIIQDIRIESGGASAAD
jgi:hypothetical protein